MKTIGIVGGIAVLVVLLVACAESPAGTQPAGEPASRTSASPTTAQPSTSQPSREERDQ